MGCQTQNVAIISDMANETRPRPRLTPKGERTRARIVAAAAALIYERGVAGTTFEDVRTAAEVSGSQLSHYFADKDELVQAVTGHQADIIVGNQEQADLSTTEGIKAWRDMVIAAARSTGAKGGCPLGSLGGQGASRQEACGCRRASPLPVRSRPGLRRSCVAGAARGGCA
jgi:TetR/AcrR family transcriptional repressor of nem operon